MRTPDLATHADMDERRMIQCGAILATAGSREPERAAYAPPSGWSSAARAHRDEYRFWGMTATRAAHSVSI
jgi:hypothetical protein